MSKILFLTTAHHYNDDRIFYHQAKDLVFSGFQVKICSLSSSFEGVLDGVEVDSLDILIESTDEKINKFLKVCKAFNPDCIICSEPLAVFAAKKYNLIKKTPIIYDITEWYPSKRMVSGYAFPLSILHGIKFFIIQLLAGYKSDAFIFGEVTKKFPLAYFFPWKQKLILPYYPKEIYIDSHIKSPPKTEITLCYTGVFSEEKGIGNFFEAVHQLQIKNPNLKVNIKLIGGARSEKDHFYFKNILAQYFFKNIDIAQPVSFDLFSKSYSDADICFDLREVNLENNHCLPIKIFYYIGSGKPVIYTNLKATREHITNFNFGYLVDPKNAKQIADYILEYVDDPEKYKFHAKNARKAFLEQYNWAVISSSFVNFVKQIL